jgi:GT2 family glycosyltransferase
MTSSYPDLSASVIICTMADPFRTAMLKDAVASVLLSESADSWELIIVDNSRTGHLQVLVDSWQAAHPERAIRWVPEPRPGVSRARNAGLEAARGRFMAFLDDDVIVPATWLHGLQEAFRQHPGIGCVAGRIRLRFEAQALPRWLDPSMLVFYSLHDRGPDSLAQPEPPCATSANMALSREAVAAVGGFDTALGRVRDLLLSGEEVDYARRLCAAGFKLAYSAEAWVWHRVTASRLRWRWMASRYYWEGVTIATMDSAARRRQMRLRTAKRILQGVLCSPWFAVLALWNPRRSARRLFRLAMHCGYWRGARFSLVPARPPQP